MKFVPLHGAVLVLSGMIHALPVLAQELDIPKVDIPTLPSAAHRAEQFKPHGWSVEKQLQGDLNADGIADVVLLLREDDPAKVIHPDGLGENPLDTNPRMLGIALGQPEGGYALVAENHALIPRRDNPTMDDPLNGAAVGGIALTGGRLRVTLGRFFSAGTWDMGSSVFTFRWQDNGFWLIGYDETVVSRNTGSTRSISVNYLTGDTKHIYGSIEDDAERIEWTQSAPAPLLSFDDIGSGFDFDPVEGP
ncbi:hypothetical protein [Qingshengfaniella alkalisoli]|uniref:Uncharacterized protein n=1 Tax=Qingshengfaniella alkalisoli TaxID=2599296 RepID=A0A5B8I990_9RHOB|nr:hypothetical protein [Qingshengfaniella alkalisoli]QDY70389.1 hypothetical protein FPZ52_11720 [Qingshengfaniella alkalisoli]